MRQECGLAEPQQRLKSISGRRYQAVLALFVLAGVVNVVLSAVTPGRFAVGSLLSAVGMTALLFSLALGRRHITGRG